MDGVERGFGGPRRCAGGRQERIERVETRKHGVDLNRPWKRSIVPTAAGRAPRRRVARFGAPAKGAIGAGHGFARLAAGTRGLVPGPARARAPARWQHQESRCLGRQKQQRCREQVTSERVHRPSSAVVDRMPNTVCRSVTRGTRACEGTGAVLSFESWVLSACQHHAEGPALLRGDLTTTRDSESQLRTSVDLFTDPKAARSGHDLVQDAGQLSSLPPPRTSEQARRRARWISRHGPSRS